MSFSPLNIDSQQVVGLERSKESRTRGESGCNAGRCALKTPKYTVPGNARKHEENGGIRTIFNPLTER